ncbi:hypothetical protein PT974_08990 [Cladobotryum mycophilum]|uniref:IBR domain-containing protein n=1 Tax=Cladobotryum mycophilum TaxID=491253 RepID=A0ABR0SFX7_9HYPO
MPYVGDDVYQDRKRRWEDDKSEVYHRVFNTEKQQALYFLNQAAQQDMQARKVMPLSKRARTTDDDVLVHDSLPPAHRRRTSPSGGGGAVGGSKPAVMAPTVRTGPVTLTPCHICHRKPTKKSDLDSFAECQGCEERTCFVCIRECQGRNADDDRASVLSEQEALSQSFHMDDADDTAQNSNNNTQQATTNNRTNQPVISKNSQGWAARGHRTMICSRCCVEKGTEGEVVCLGCLSSMEAS